MTIAFDLDGTISRYPQVLLCVAKALRQTGHRVIVLTAAAGELPPPHRPAEVSRRLTKLGWNGFETVCTETANKPADIKRLSVDLLIDDTPFAGVCQLIPN